MEPHRIAVKVFLEDPQGLDPEELVPVFHEIIREEAVTGIPIDVARYAHVVDGPGVMIIGHQQDHALDEAAGRPGLSATRKRDADGTLAERVLQLVGDVARLSVELQADPALSARARVATGEVLVTVLDRYEAPNDDETLVRATPALREVIAALSADGGEDAATITREGTHRDPFTVRIALDQPRGLAQWAAHASPLGALA
jgi:hypothetical protein